MTIFAYPKSTHQFDPGDPVMKIPNPVGIRNPHMGFLHAMREGEEMYLYPVGSQGFTEIWQEGSQFLYMHNNLVGNRDIEAPRGINPTRIHRDEYKTLYQISNGARKNII